MLFLGDTHAHFDDMLTLLAKFNFKNEHILHVGDVGFGFEEPKYEYQLLSSINESLIENNNILYVIRGNHDDPSYWLEQKLPKLKNIVLVKDYTILNIEDNNILCIGGALSIDRINRTEGINYWKNESIVPNFDFINSISENVIDLVVTHAPIARLFTHISGLDMLNKYISLDKELKNEIDIEQKLLEEYNNILREKHNLKMWISGHFHISHTEYIDGTKYKVLNINEFYELPAG